MKPQEKPAKRQTYRERVLSGKVKPKPRSKLRKVAVTKAAPMSSYHAWIKACKEGIGMTKCPSCQWSMEASSMDPHHPYGRLGQNLWKVVLVCRACHDSFHLSPSDALARGWLQPEYRGYVSSPKHPKPFRLLPVFGKRFVATITTTDNQVHIQECDARTEATAFIRQHLDNVAMDGGSELWTITDNLILT